MVNNSEVVFVGGHRDQRGPRAKYVPLDSVCAENANVVVVGCDTAPATANCEAFCGLSVFELVVPGAGSPPLIERPILNVGTLDTGVDVEPGTILAVFA